MRFSLYILIGSMLYLFGVTAKATLGENESSVLTDLQDMPHARHVRSVSLRYQVHQLTAGASTILEYSDLNGTVFAITWNGPNIPVLSGLLGKYAQDFATEIQRDVRRQPAGFARSRLSKTHLEAGRVTIDNNGHMGSQRGRAYLPTLIPVDVKLDEIQ